MTIIHTFVVIQIYICCNSFLSFLLQKVKEMWGIIKAMSNNLPIVHNDDPLKCRSTPAVQKALVSQARNYLQQG